MYPNDMCDCHVLSTFEADQCRRWHHSFASFLLVRGSWHCCCMTSSFEAPPLLMSFFEDEEVSCN